MATFAGQSPGMESGDLHDPGFFFFLQELTEFLQAPLQDGLT